MKQGNNQGLLINCDISQLINLSATDHLTVGNDSPAELSVTELRTRNDVRGASLNRMSGLTKSKLRGFKVSFIL